MPPWKPTLDQIKAAQDQRVPDLFSDRLLVVFSGINPSLYSAAVGHHFARPGNRFWPAIHRAGFTPRQFSPFEDRELLQLGFGITNVVDRATATADELAVEELIAGGRRLQARTREHQPRVVAFLGITAYRTAFQRPRATIGRQPESFEGAALWALPNPSGLNAHYRLDALARLYSKLREAAQAMLK